jgi:hypothetical protein
MQEIVTAVTQIGILPVIILFLLWDYSKKLATIQVEAVKCSETVSSLKRDSELILSKLEKLEDRV